MNSTVPGDFTTASDCDFDVIGETYLAQGSNAADGTPQTFSVVQNDQRLDVSAVLEPSIPPTNTPSNAFNLERSSAIRRRELRR